MEIVKTLQEIVNELDSMDTYDEGIAGRLSEIEKIQLETLVKRLFIIDSKLTSENAQLVSEYNQIVEEIYAAIAKIRTDNEKSMVLSRKNMR